MGMVRVDKRLAGAYQYLRFAKSILTSLSHSEAPVQCKRARSSGNIKDNLRGGPDSGTSGESHLMVKIVKFCYPFKDGEPNRA